MTHAKGETSDVTAREKCAAWFDASRICVNCGATFTERGNLGTLKCAIHPEVHTTRDEYGGYQCCGRRVGSEGCCRADHVEQLYGGELDLTMASPKMTFKRRSMLAFSESEFSLLGGTKAERDTYIVAETWTQPSTGAWQVMRVDLRRYNIARHALCRNNATAGRVFACRRWQPIK